MAMMLVVDASVALKWILDEDGSEIARGLLGSDQDFRAPMLLLVEVHNTLAKRFNRREIPFDQFADAVHLLRTIVALHPLEEPLVLKAWEVSLFAKAEQGQPRPASDVHAFSIYDSIYVALAVGLDAPLITADEKQATAAERFGVTVQRI